MSDYPLEKSLLYKKYKEDMEHIGKNRWYMSERCGYDVGIERALLDWILNHKPRKKRLNSSVSGTTMMIHASASL